jgi:hypothetical protein
MRKVRDSALGAGGAARESAKYLAALGGTDKRAKVPRRRRPFRRRMLRGA